MFCKNDSILWFLLFKFRFEKLILSSAKCAQNKHEKNWRTQAKLLDFRSDDIMRKAKKEVKIFKLLVKDYLQLAEKQTINCFDIG